MILRLTTLTLFPYTTLFRSAVCRRATREVEDEAVHQLDHRGVTLACVVGCRDGCRDGIEMAGYADDSFGLRHELHVCLDDDRQDRKSTRLNSSHGYISYAVF